jgi:hypothetical protein
MLLIEFARSTIITNTRDKIPAIDGSITRAPLNIDKLSAIAFIRSSRPTMSLKYLPCRDVGVHRAHQSHKHYTSHTLAASQSQHSQNPCQHHRARLRGNHYSLPIPPVRHHAIGAKETLESALRSTVPKQ